MSLRCWPLLVSAPPFPSRTVLPFPSHCRNASEPDFLRRGVCATFTVVRQETCRHNAEQQLAAGRMPHPHLPPWLLRAERSSAARMPRSVGLSCGCSPPAPALSGAEAAAASRVALLLPDFFSVLARKL